MSNTLEQLRNKAADIELAGVNFLAADGELARQKKAVASAEFIFIDGTRLLLPKAEMDRPGFADLAFKLRPSRDNA